jgi:protein O-GlcNAc transferase
MSQPVDIVKSLRSALEHHRSGRLTEAKEIYARVLAQDPKQADALNLLGVLTTQSGDAEAGLLLLQRAIAAKPGVGDFHENLGDALSGLGRYDEAIAAWRKAISLNPRQIRSHYLLGAILGNLGRYEEAIATLQAADQVKPDDAEILNNLGYAHFMCGRLDEAYAAISRAAKLQPNLAKIEMNLGFVWLARADHGNAMEWFNRAIAHQPKSAIYLSARIMSMHYDPAFDAKALLKAGREWDEAVGLGLLAGAIGHGNDRSPDRKLRIGYLSADFRHHVVGHCILSLLAHADRERFEIYCYANMPCDDEVTAKLRELSTGWRNIHFIKDDKAAEMIRADGIDILVDLALHSHGNRMPIFAMKPAPIQVGYLAYCSTTGVSAMDYRFSDPHIDPPDVELTDYSERTVRLPRTYICYEPIQETPEVGPPPASLAGHITFGCLNNFSKCSSPALDAWARILADVPGSRLIFHAKPGEHLELVRKRFEGAGVARERLEFLGERDWPRYIGTYGRIDIALDPFPYNGGITTCDALWMGVPVVALSGKTAIGRVGRSILSNMSLPELIARTPDEYVRIAVELANDSNRLKTYRAELRGRMLASPLKDPKQLMRDIETFFGDAWHTFTTSSK